MLKQKEISAMKTIGLLGGMSWESTALYYRLINEGIKTKLGGLHSARMALVSVDFQEIKEMQHQGDWLRAGQSLAQAAKQEENCFHQDVNSYKHGGQSRQIGPAGG